MLSQHGIQLAVHLISSYFGPTVATAEESTLEARALAVAAPMESIRFFVGSDTLNDVPEEANNENSTNKTLGTKRKQDLESDTDEWATNNKKKKFLGGPILRNLYVGLGIRLASQVYFVYLDSMIEYKLFPSLCIANVRMRLDDEAGIVLSAILEATRSAETKVKLKAQATISQAEVKTESSVSLSIDTIFEEVMKSEEGRSMMTSERVRASLIQLGCHNPTIGLDETCTIDLKNIIELAQNHEVESIVLKKYGREAYRIVRLLSASGRLLETDKISNTTFVEKKETAKLLFQLWKDDYVHMEKIMISGAKQLHFLLWKLNKSSLWEHVLDDMYHAAINLRLHSTHELEREKELLLIPRDKLQGDFEKRVNRLRKVRNVLEFSLMKLDDALMLFHDF